MVEFGLAHRKLTGINAIGVDEIHYKKDHNYLTVIYQLDQGAKRLLYFARKRSVKSLLGFLRLFGKQAPAEIKFFCSDMGAAYSNHTKKSAAIVACPRSVSYCAKLNQAVGQVRKAEANSMAENSYEPLLKTSKYCFLKREENLTEKQAVKFDDLMQYDRNRNVKCILCNCASACHLIPELWI